MTLTRYPEPVLRARSLRRTFGSRVAVDDVSLAVRPGEIVSILGPNGAGKTTTVRMCATLLSPTSGSIRVDGVDAVADPRSARRRTGLVLGGDGGFYSRASARRNLLFFADIAGVPTRERRARVSDAFAAVGLEDRAGDAVRTYSRGMKQRLHLAKALLGRPRLLLLDEPTNGLDPQIASDIRSLIRTLTERGSAVLMTSHLLSEVEQLADSIQVIVGGREIARGSVADISTASGVAHVTTFTTDRSPDPLARAIGESGRLVAAEDAGRWRIRVAWRSVPDPALVGDWLAQLGDPVPVDLISRPATLEESYLALVGDHR